MNYRVNFDSLDALYNSINSQSASWNGELQTIQNAVNAIIESGNISGAGADNIKTYFEYVHGTILTALAEIITSHLYNCLIYKQDYQSSIDTALHAVIEYSELESILSSIGVFVSATQNVEAAANGALYSVQDIFPLSLNGTDNVYGAGESVKGFITELDSDICDLETRHFNGDFSEIESAIGVLKTFIQEQLSKARGYKTDFTAEQLVESGSFVQLYRQCEVLDNRQREQSALIDQAIENENTRIADLQREYEERLEREEDMKIVKWIVTGVCVIGSVVAIAATGGAATPLVVGAVSAVSGAVMAGANTIADQYAANGDLSLTDWGAVGKNALVGGITGFVTGYIGAGVGGAITSGLSKTAAGATLLNSSNVFVRVGTGAAIGAVSETSSGILSRGAATFITTGDVDQALDQAFDLKSIAFDATMGGVSGGINAAKNPMGKKYDLNNFDDSDIIDNKPLNSPEPKKWIENGGQIHIDGNGTWTYTSADGVSVCYTNNYPDFKRAGLVYDSYSLEDGFDTRNHSVDINKAKTATGEGGAGSGMTWHHNQDGSTLQLVPTKYHKLFTHRGGFSIAKGG